MNFESLIGAPKEPGFIALSFAERLALEDGFDFEVYEQTEGSWKAQIENMDPDSPEQRIGPGLKEVNYFISKLIEFLDFEYPQYDWQNFISLDTYKGVYKIKFEIPK